MKFKPSERESAFIQSHRVARMATVDKLENPLVLPICYAYHEKNIYTPIDKKPKRINIRNLKRIRNIEENPNVSIVIDDYHEDWNMLCYVIIHGTAELIYRGNEYQESLRILTEKYKQYKEMDLPNLNLPVIKIIPKRILSWGNI